MAITFRKDPHKSIEGVVKQVIQDNREFEVLRNLQFLFTYRMTDPAYDRDGYPVEAVTKKLSTRERDVHQKDVEICVHHESWESMPEKQKTRLIYRQLLSIFVEMDEGSMEVEYDEGERVKFKIIPPEICIRVFEKEIEKYGMPTLFQPALTRLTGLKKPRMQEDGGE